MKKFMLIVAFLVASSAVYAQNADSLLQETTLIFVRHAEKMNDGTNDPSLNKKGEQRAIRLSQLLMKEYHISAVYSTPYNRTKQTAKPIADSLNVSVLEYDLSDPNHFVEKLIEDYKGLEILVVGHSNTTPMLVNIALGTGFYEQLDENTYDKIFVVKANSVGRACSEVITY